MSFEQWPTSCKSFLEVADQSPMDFINAFALKSSATDQRPIADWSPTGCSVSFKKTLFHHPDIILPKALKVGHRGGQKYKQKHQSRRWKLPPKFRLLILMMTQLSYSDAESVSSELVGPSRTITAITAAFCFVVSEAHVSIVLS